MHLLTLFLNKFQLPLSCPIDQTIHTFIQSKILLFTVNDTANYHIISKLLMVPTYTQIINIYYKMEMAQN